MQLVCDVKHVHHESYIFGIMFLWIGKSKAKEEENNDFSNYPLILWMLVAVYIPPEDVLAFSLINKTTLSIVNTRAFWIRLYER